MMRETLKALGIRLMSAVNPLCRQDDEMCKILKSNGTLGCSDRVNKTVLIPRWQRDQL